MIPTWKTEEKDKNLRKKAKIAKIGFTYSLTDPDFKFSQGNNCKHMH